MAGHTLAHLKGPNRPVMPSGRAAIDDSLRQVLDGVLRTLSVRERSVLRLLYRRGATQRELAGALGISRAALRRMLKKALKKATDPMQLALVRSWKRLSPEQQRLVYLHRILDLSLREIARRGLVSGTKWGGGRGRRPSVSTLRRQMKRIENKVRHTEAALADPPQHDEPSRRRRRPFQQGPDKDARHEPAPEDNPVSSSSQG